MNSKLVRAGAFFVVALLVLTSSACIQVGRNFVRPDPQAVTFHSTTKAVIIGQFGQPFSTGQFLKNGQLIDSFHYFHGRQEPTARVLYKRHCWFYFVGDELVGYLYLSGFPAEQRDFDARSVPWIVKGKTTKTEVIGMFGPPLGFLQFPVTEDKKTVAGDNSIIYAYHFAPPGGGNFVNKYLEVLFDANGVTKDVTFEVSQKNPSTGGQPPYGGGEP